MKQMLEVSGEECPMIAIILLHWTLIVGPVGGPGPILGWTGAYTHTAVAGMHRNSEELCLRLANHISETNLTV